MPLFPIDCTRCAFLWLLTVVITDTANGPADVKQHLLVCAVQQWYQSRHQTSIYTGALHFLCKNRREKSHSPPDRKKSKEIGSHDWIERNVVKTRAVVLNLESFGWHFWNMIKANPSPFSLPCFKGKSRSYFCVPLSS